MTGKILIFSMIAASRGVACGANEPPLDARSSDLVGPTTTVPTATTSTIPPPAFDAGAPHGGLHPEQVRRVVMSHTGALRACYEVVASSNPDLRGGVTVAWEDPQGNVHHARIIESTLAEPKVGECVVRQIASWQFDTANAPTFVASYPFRFGIGTKDAGAR